MRTAPGFKAKKPAPEEDDDDIVDPAPPQNAAREDLEEDEAEGNVTPEEQQEYDLFVGQALNLIATPEHQKVRDALVKLLSAGEDRVAALASAAVYVVEGVEKSAGRAGKEFNVDVLLHGGQEITEHLADFAKAKKIHAFSPEEVEAAFLQAVDQYRLKNQGRLDPEAAQQDLQEVAAAEESGEIDQVMPGLKEAAMKGQEIASGEGAPVPPEEEEAV